MSSVIYRSASTGVLDTSLSEGQGETRTGVLFSLIVDVEPVGRNVTESLKSINLCLRTLSGLKTYFRSESSIGTKPTLSEMRHVRRTERYAG